MIIRAVTDADHPAWAAMRTRLWPDADPKELESELAGLFALDPPYTVGEGYTNYRKGVGMLTPRFGKRPAA